MPAGRSYATSPLLAVKRANVDCCVSSAGLTHLQWTAGWFTRTGFHLTDMSSKLGLTSRSRTRAVKPTLDSVQRSRPQH